MREKLIAASAAIFLSGCTPDLTVLANDKNALCIEGSYIYGSVHWEKNGGCHYPPPGFVLVPVVADQK